MKLNNYFTYVEYKELLHFKFMCSLCSIGTCKKGIFFI